MPGVDRYSGTRSYSLSRYTLYGIHVHAIWIALRMMSWTSIDIDESRPFNNSHLMTSMCGFEVSGIKVMPFIMIAMAITRLAMTYTVTTMLCSNNVSAAWHNYSTVIHAPVTGTTSGKYCSNAVRALVCLNVSWPRSGAVFESFFHKQCDCVMVASD